MAECYNDVFIFTRDNRCVFRSGCEFQKCACINGKRVGEQCKHNALESERSIGAIKLNRVPTTQPLVPIEPIVKSKEPRLFINDMIRYKRRLYDEPKPPTQSLKSHVVREFKFACDTEENARLTTRRNERVGDASHTITHACFTIN